MLYNLSSFLFFFFNDTSTTEIYTLSLHDALPIFTVSGMSMRLTDFPISFQSLGSFSFTSFGGSSLDAASRSEEHTSELQSLRHLVCRLLLEKKKKKKKISQSQLRLFICKNTISHY